MQIAISIDRGTWEKARGEGERDRGSGLLETGELEMIVTMPPRPYFLKKELGHPMF